MSSSSSSSGSDSETEAPQQRARVASSSSSASSHHSPAPVARAATPEAGSGSGSERSHASPERSQQRRLIASSSDEEEQGEKKSPKEAKHGDVFGDEVSSDSDNEEGDAAKAPRASEDEDAEDNKSDAGSDGSIRGIQMYNDPDEEQQVDEDLPPSIITSEVPRLKLNIGDEIFHVRMPNFLSIETRGFSAHEYEHNDEEHLVMDEEGRNRLKLKVENTIRWRKVPGTSDKYESNAKVVKWSDGTMSLYLGNEIFELSETRLLADTHLYVRQTHGLAGKAVFQKRIKFRPCSTESKTHKKVTMNMADRTKKSGQVRFIQEIGNNPDDAKRETVRREEEALRAAFRRERDTTVRTRREPERRGMNSGFLEDRDFSDDGSPTRGRRREAPIIGASSDEESDGDKRVDRSKEASSDSDEEFRKNRPQKKKIVSSDEDSD